MVSLENVIERLLFEQNGYVGRHLFTLTPTRQTSILPPWTGRTAKSIALKLSCLDSLKTLYLESERFKPVTFSVLHHPRRGPLYVAARKGAAPITLSRGETVIISVGFYTKNPMHIASCSPEEVDVGYASFYVSPTEMFFQSLSKIPAVPLKKFKIRILTPMTISTKIMAPDIPDQSPLAPKLRNAPERYRLLPTPGYIVAQLLRQWLTIVAGQPEKSNLPKLLGGLANSLIAEQYYRIRPVTVAYGKDEQGKMRLVRGVIGSIELEVLDDWIARILTPLLVLGEYLGVGKSRSIGFGEIQVEKLGEAQQ